TSDARTHPGVPFGRTGISTCSQSPRPSVTSIVNGSPKLVGLSNRQPPGPARRPSTGNPTRGRGGRAGVEACDASGGGVVGLAIVTFVESQSSGGVERTWISGLRAVATTTSPGDRGTSVVVVVVVGSGSAVSSPP